MRQNYLPENTAEITKGLRFRRDSLFEFFDAGYDQLGVKCAYINSSGDTILPIAKYHYCNTKYVEKFCDFSN